MSLTKDSQHRGLYKTIAISDAFNAAGHWFAAYECFKNGNTAGAIGFGSVALAATIGTLRFGFSETRYARANNRLAGWAAFVGLPLVGYSVPSWQLIPSPVAGKLFPWSSFSALEFIAGVSVLQMLIESFAPESQVDQVWKVLVNFLLFIYPLAVAAYLKNHVTLMVALAVFVVSGAVIGPDRHRTLFGVRRENLFHYGIGLAAVLFVVNPLKWL